MKIEFRYSIEDELTRVQNTLEKMLWYREQGYRPTLPVGISETSPEKEIREAVETAYREKDYREAEQDIRRDFSECLDRFLQVLAKYSLEVPENLIMKLTQFGTSGSYQFPNFVVFDIHDVRGLKTIYHEIAHLAFEQEFLQNNVSHWQRERIIDLFLHTEDCEFLQYDIWQRDYHGVELSVDPVFAELFLVDRSAFYVRVCGPR